MTVSMLPCDKISPAERTGTNDHYVALICEFLSYCCKNTSLTISGLKQYLFFFKLDDSTSRPECLASLLRTGCWQGSYGELSEAAAATWTQMESKIQLLGTEKLFHFLGSSRTESFIFHRPLSILAHPSVSWRQQLHVALHTWNLRFPPSPHLSGSSSLLLRSSILKSPMITLHPSQNLAYSISKPIN